MSTQDPQSSGRGQVVYCRDPKAAALTLARHMKSDLRIPCTLAGITAYGRREYKATGKGLSTVTFRQEQGGHHE